MSDERHLERYYGYENLVGLGGFVGEKAQSMLYGLLPKDVSNAIERTGGIDTSFWALVPELEDIYDEYLAPESYMEQEDGTEEAVYVEKGEGSFYQFRLNATAVCVRKKIKQNRKTFYAKWEISKSLRKLLDSLSPLEEVVLAEYLGIGKAESCSIEDISRNTDFYSTPDHIRQLLYRIESRFMYYPEEREELAQCAAKQKEGGL